MTSRILGGVGRTLVVLGLLILGFVVYQLWGTSLEESRNQGDLTESLSKAAQPSRPSASTDLDQVTKTLGKVDPSTAPATPPPAEGDPVGVIEIPKIGVQRVIVEGVERPDLKKGPGHYPTTPLPGQKGNAAIAGHRTTYGAPFNRIDELVPGDMIIVTTPQGRFDYTVRPAPGQTDQAWWAVAPTDVYVLDNSEKNLLTLTACHPKYSARQRIIVQAELTSPVAASTPAPSPATKASRTARDLDEGQGGESSALPVAIVFGVGAFLIWAAAWALGRRWKRWPSYLIAAPFVFVLIVGAYVYLDRWLPVL